MVPFSMSLSLSPLSRNFHIVPPPTNFSSFFSYQIRSTFLYFFFPVSFLSNGNEINFMVFKGERRNWKDSLSYRQLNC